MARLPRLRQGKLIGAGGLVHAEDLLHLAGAVARGVHNQQQGPLFSHGLVPVGQDGFVDGGGHLIGFLHTDDAEIDHRETGVDGLGVIGQDGDGSAVEAGGAHHGAGAVALRHLGATHPVFRKAVGIYDHSDGIPAAADH